MKKIVLTLALLTSVFTVTKAQIGPCSGTPMPLITAQNIPACTSLIDTLYANAFLNKGLVAYYPFNGNANDLSGNGYNATTVGVSLATDRFGKPNKCYNFAGTSTYIQCPSAAYFTGGSFTISGWVNISSLENWARMMDFGNGAGSDNVLVALSDGTSNQPDMSSTGQNFTTSQVLDFNTWVQVLFTYNVNTGYSTCYYNGVAIDSNTINQPNNVVRNQAYIGLSDWASDGGVYGSMDDIRIYNRNLSSAEVTQLYNYEATGESQTTYSWSGGSNAPYIVSNQSTPTTVTYTLTQMRDGASCSAADTLRLATVNCTDALDFDGNDDFVDIGSAISNTTAYTKEAWIYATASGCNNIISSTNSPMWLSGGQLGSSHNFSGGVDVQDPNQFPLNVWTHVAVTYDASNTTMILYVNGMPVSTNTGASSFYVEDIEIGAFGGGCPFQGQIDEVLLWNVARTQAQIQKDMNCSPTGTPAGLSAYYNFNDGAPNGSNAGVNVLYDKTTNGNDGVLTNFALTGTTSNWVTDAKMAGPVPSITSVVASNTLVCSGTTTTLTVNGTATTYTWGANAANATTTSVNVNPTATATYVVVAANNNCKVMDSVTVNVNPLPNVVITTHTLVCVGTKDTLFASGATTFTWTPGGSHATEINGIINTPKTFTLTGTDGNGCLNKAIETISVNVLPTVGVIVTNSVICIGDATTLTGAGTATTYTWTGGVTDGTPFNPSATLSYTVTGTDANGCKNKNSQTITVNSLPTVSASTTNSVICMGDATTLMGGGAITYTWTSGVIDNTAFNPSATNTYTVSGTDANGCVSQNIATVDVTVNPLPTVSANATNTVICAGGSTTLMGAGANTYTWTSGVTDNTPFNPAGTGVVTYTVSGTENVNGCTNMAVISVTVNALPNVTVNSPSICTGATTTLTASGAVSYTWSTTDNTASIIETPTTPTDYTVNGTDGNGCVNMAVASVMINPLPTVTITPSSTTICLGTVTTLTASGAATYTWSTGDATATTTVSPSASSQDFTVTATDANNCTNTAIATVSVNPTPTISVTSNTVNLCSGNSTTLTASGASTYTWSTSDIGMTTVVSPTITATYTVTGNDANGCQDMTTFTQTVTICSGIAQYSNAANITVYPNPSNGLFNMTLDVDAQLIVTNALGEVVLTKTVSAGTHDIDVQNQMAGVYFVRVVQHNSQQTIKLIKN